MSKTKHNVCLIDDDNIYQYTAKVLLESTGMTGQIYAFYNGLDALNFFTDHKDSNIEILPDVIFLDINMPVMNGWEFLEEYQKIYQTLAKSIVVYVVSSSVDTDDMLKSRSFSAVTDYLIKPVNRTKFMELIERL